MMRDLIRYICKWCNDVVIWVSSVYVLVTERAALTVVIAPSLSASPDACFSWRSRKRCASVHMTSTSTGTCDYQRLRTRQLLSWAVLTSTSMSMSWTPNGRLDMIETILISQHSPQYRKKKYIPVKAICTPEKALLKLQGVRILVRCRVAFSVIP